jgi:hypothetical protein
MVLLNGLHFIAKNRDLETVIGNAASINPGEYVEAFGFWVNDKKHGLQPRFLIFGLARL